MPPADAAARCIHAEQAVTFRARARRRLRSDSTVVFVLVPLTNLQHADQGRFTRGEWLVWNDHSEQGIVARLPSGGADIAAAISPGTDEGQLARRALTEVVDAVWRLVAH